MPRSLCLCLNWSRRINISTTPISFSKRTSQKRWLVQNLRHQQRSYSSLKKSSSWSFLALCHITLSPAYPTQLWYVNPPKTYEMYTVHIFYITSCSNSDTIAKLNLFSNYFLQIFNSTTIQVIDKVRHLRISVVSWYIVVLSCLHTSFSSAPDNNYFRIGWSK